MSQWGAEGYAVHGWGWKRILAHYYPGTALLREEPRTVRVLLAEGKGRVMLGSRAPFVVRDGHGRRVRLEAGRHAVSAGLRLGGKRLAAPLRVVPGLAPVSVDGRGYRGEILLYRSAGALQVVNEVLLERYLRGVVPWEMPHDWQPEALRAQAVAARSYALATANPGGRYDLVSDTRDQMYGGIEAETPETNLAVGATAGQVLMWDGEVALTYYSSTSGGRTESVSDAFHVEPVPYLRAVADPYDTLSPHHKWGPFRFAPGVLAKKLGVPAVEKLRVRRNASGRVANLVVRWRTGWRVITGRDVEHALSLPSTWFVVSPTAGGALSRPSVPAARPVHGWLAVLASLPHGASPKLALVRARKAVPEARAVDSSAFAGLRPGLVIVVAGPFALRADALADAERVSGAFVRHV
jgi:stage II sporulation protein D